jgi:hypothetical protein
VSEYNQKKPNQVSKPQDTESNLTTPEYEAEGEVNVNVKVVPALN